MKPLETEMNLSHKMVQLDLSPQDQSCSVSDKDQALCPLQVCFQCSSKDSRPHTPPSYAARTKLLLEATAFALLVLIQFPRQAIARDYHPSINLLAVPSYSFGALPAETSRVSTLQPQGNAGISSPKSTTQTNTPEYLTGIFISIATSLFASFLFWLALYMRRPNIIISPVIIRHSSTQGIDYYLVKLINASRTDLVGLKYELHLVSPRPHKWITLPNGKQKEVRLLNKTKLKLGIDGARTESMILKRYLRPSKDVNGEALYAQVFSVSKDKQVRKKTLDGLLAGSTNGYLLFSVYAVHPASGFGKAFSKVYSREDIVDGEEFAWGKSFDVLQGPTVEIVAPTHQA